MDRFEWDWFIGCTTAAVITLGIAAAIFFGVMDTNQKYYASMDKCISSGGSFIPMRGGEAVCMVGVKQ